MQDLLDLSDFEELVPVGSDLSHRAAQLIIDNVCAENNTVSLSASAIFQAENNIMQSVASGSMEFVAVAIQDERKHPRHYTINQARNDKEAWEKVGGPVQHIESVVKQLSLESIVKVSFFDDVTGGSGVSADIRRRGIGSVETIEVLDEMRFAEHMFASDASKISASIIPYPCKSKSPWKTVKSVFSKLGFECRMPKGGSLTGSKLLPNFFQWSKDLADKECLPPKGKRQARGKRRATEREDEGSHEAGATPAPVTRARPATTIPQSAESPSLPVGTPPMANGIFETLALPVDTPSPPLDSLPLPAGAMLLRRSEDFAFASTVSSQDSESAAALRSEDLASSATLREASSPPSEGPSPPVDPPLSPPEARVSLETDELVTWEEVRESHSPLGPLVAMFLPYQGAPPHNWAALRMELSWPSVSPPVPPLPPPPPLLLGGGEATAASSLLWEWGDELAACL